MLAISWFPGQAQAGDVEYTQKYEGDEFPTEAFPFWAEVKGRDKNPGLPALESGKLQVSIPERTRHYYAIGQTNKSIDRGLGLEGYNGSSPDGTTIDFCVTVACENPEEQIFGMMAGSEDRGWTVLFSPAGITCAGKFIPCDATAPDVYRIAFDSNEFALFSARLGELFRAPNPPRRGGNPNNVIFFGTLASIENEIPGEWEVDFIRWTNGQAVFSPPTQAIE